MGVPMGKNFIPSEPVVDKLKTLVEEKRQEKIRRETPVKREPIVLGERAGRNDPCPCGSGKKYKKCCLLKEAS